jgi:hypothetical protein
MKIYLSIKELSHFLFPDARRIKSYGYTNSTDTVLYEIKQGENISVIENEIRVCHENYILLTSFPSHAVEVSLEERKNYIDYISANRGIRSAKDIEIKVEKMGDDDFILFIKMSLVLRRWYREIFVKATKIYSLYEALFKSKKDFIRLYLELNQTLTYQEIFSSVLTFLLRIKNREEQKAGLSEYYKNLTKLASNQKINVPLKLINLLKTSKSIPLENRLLGFYLFLK